jgi:predicted DNA-binding protein (UPF0251 family)
VTSKGNSLSPEKELEIIREVEKQDTTKMAAATKYGISPLTLSTILQQRDLLAQKFESGACIASSANV